MSNNLVIVFGASGLLGSSLVPFMKKKGMTVIALGRNKENCIFCDTSSSSEVRTILEEYKPSVVINLIAETNVDLCEVKPQLAWSVNVKIVMNIVEGIKYIHKKYGINSHLIHISSDQVYDGKGPHSERDVNPINVYGITKHMSELVALQVNSTVLRTNFFGKSQSLKKSSLSDWIIDSLKKSKNITVFEDVYFSGININSLCNYINLCAEKKIIGVFNVGCRDAISKSEFAKTLALMADVSFKSARYGSVEEIQFRAQRPKNMSLEISLFEKTFEVDLPYIKEEIKTIALEYK